MSDPAKARFSHQDRALARHRSPRALASFVLIARLLLVDSPLAAQSLVIDTVSPLSGKEGDLITLTGSGFDTARDHALFFSDGFSGVTATVLSASPTQLVARLDPVGYLSPGKVHLGVGDSYALPDTTFVHNNQLYVLSDLSWFKSRVAIQGHDDLAARELSSKTVSSIRDTDDLRFIAADRFVSTGDETDKTITLKVVVVSIPPKSGIVLMCVITITMCRLSTTPSVDSAELAADLAAAIQHVFGALGFTASVQGDELVVSYVGGLTGGVGVLSVRPSLQPLVAALK